MNRGRRTERIFYDHNDSDMFIELLTEASENWRIRVSAYCLMPDHYHLLIQTPEANLSQNGSEIEKVSWTIVGKTKQESREDLTPLHVGFNDSEGYNW